MAAPPEAGRPAGATDEPAGGSGRLRLLVAYDGRPFQGWQSQARGDTVQDRLEAALSALCGGARIAVHGSGRTDSGVHARGQVAHADVPGRERRAPAVWRAALNAHLPPTIRVLRAQAAPAAFHARFSACGKLYRYRVWNAPVLPPLEHGRCWHFPSPLDLDTLRQGAQLLVGTHDFAGFSANRGTAPTSTVRTLERIEVVQRGRLLRLDFEGSGFLYKMARLLTGSLVRCAQGCADLRWLEQILAGAARTSFAAPAEGLCLMRVRYAPVAPR